MTNAEATTYLNTLPANIVREAATYIYCDVAGADWDGKTFSLLRNGEWYKHSAALSPSVARYLKRTEGR